MRPVSKILAGLVILPLLTGPVVLSAFAGLVGLSAFADEAFAASPWSVFVKSGLAGRWAISCKAAPSDKNPWMSYYEGDGGTVRRKLDRGPGTGNYNLTIDSADIQDDGTVRASMRNDDPAWATRMERSPSWWSRSPMAMRTPCNSPRPRASNGSRMGSFSATEHRALPLKNARTDGCGRHSIGLTAIGYTHPRGNA